MNTISGMNIHSFIIGSPADGIYPHTSLSTSIRIQLAIRNGLLRQSSYVPQLSLPWLNPSYQERKLLPNPILGFKYSIDRCLCADCVRFDWNHYLNRYSNSYLADPQWRCYDYVKKFETTETSENRVSPAALNAFSLPRTGHLKWHKFPFGTLLCSTSQTGDLPFFWQSMMEKVKGTRPGYPIKN